MTGRICIAEDSKSQARIAERIFADRGYEVILAENGMDALYKIAEKRPDVIISDVEMPHMNGFDLCRTIKSDTELKTIPFILLTLLSSITDVVKGLEAGADYYLTKPYNADVLTAMVGSILENGPASENGTHTVKFSMPAKDSLLCFHAEPQKVFNFLHSTYENLVQQNHHLLITKQELRKLNNLLEEKIREKTRFLEGEVAERRRAENALKESLENMRKTVDGTVRALATTIEMRDPYTAGHQRRVAQLSCAIGRHMNYSADFIDGLEVMGFLHDIGKIIVPAEILSKPGSLNEFEFNIIKAHAQAGYNILKGIEFPWPVAAATIQHHERLNGSGYPYGLQAEAIIMEARILAVADVVEAMATHRPYRPALGMDIALKEITQNSGTLYDPAVVEACVLLFQQGRFSFM